jgi:hypothetical protein
VPRIADAAANAGPHIAGDVGLGAAAYLAGCGGEAPAPLVSVRPICPIPAVA